jgi:hypothetical protein
MKRTICFSTLLLLAATAASLRAGTVMNVAPSGAIIDSSGSLNAWLAPAHVLDGQVDEAANATATYWLAPAGAANGYFILDLKRAYAVTSASLYNTHNRGTNDSGTAEFTLTASEEIAPNFVSLDRYYSFEGTVTDQSPNAVDGIMLDAGLNPMEPVFSNDVPAAVTGDTKSLYFSGGGESLEIPDPLGFNQPVQYSYALWVKFLTNDFQPQLKAASLLLRSAAPGQEQATWSHQLRLTATGKFEAYTYDGALKTVTGTTTVQPNTWYHVACSAANGGQLILYVNGVQEGTPVAVATLWAGGSVTEVATGSGGFFNPAAELIDDLGIWYSALTPDRVKLLSQGASPASVGAAKGFVLVNPKTVASGTLPDVSGQDQITPAVYSLTTPVTARYFRFDALAPRGVSPGLNELQLTSDVTLPQLTTGPAIELAWAPTPLARTPYATRDLASPAWTPLSNAPSVVGNTLKLFQEVTSSAAFYLLPAPAGGGSVATNVAPSGTIAIASSVYNADFAPAHVIDGRTDEASTSPSTYWLASDGVTEANFVVDLGSSYAVKSVTLFNTHNRQFNDRGTSAFELWVAGSMGTTQTPTNVARYYSLNSELNDGSGNQVPAVYLDGPVGNEIPGDYVADSPAVLGGGQSLVFSGTEARFEVIDPADATQPTEYSISLWVKLSDLSLPRSVIVRTAGSGQEMTAWSHQLRVTGNGQFQAYTYDGSEVSVTSATVAQPNHWYHLVATAQNMGQMHLYVNGVEEGTPARVGTLWAGGTRWTIGTGSGAGYSQLVGQVDELAIWFGALPPEAVKALSTGAKPTTLAAISSPPPQMINPTLMVSGSLSDVSAMDQITPDNFSLNTPVSARFLQFKTLAATYASGNVGLNEIQVVADVAGTKLGAAPAVLLSWPYSPIKAVLQTSPDGTTWTTVSEPPTLTEVTYKLFRPYQPGVTYRLVAP